MHNCILCQNYPQSFMKLGAEVCEELNHDFEVHVLLTLFFLVFLFTINRFKDSFNRILKKFKILKICVQVHKIDE